MPTRHVLMSARQQGISKVVFSWFPLYNVEFMPPRPQITDCHYADAYRVANQQQTGHDHEHDATDQNTLGHVLTSLLWAGGRNPPPSDRPKKS